MQQSLTMDKGFTEETSKANKTSKEAGFPVDKGLLMFLVLMIALLILFGTLAQPGSFVPPDYQTFW